MQGNAHARAVIGCPLDTAPGPVKEQQSQHIQLVSDFLSVYCCLYQAEAHGSRGWRIKNFGVIFGGYTKKTVGFLGGKEPGEVVFRMMSRPMKNASAYLMSWPEDPAWPDPFGQDPYDMTC